MQQDLQQSIIDIDPTAPHHYHDGGNLQELLLEANSICKHLCQCGRSFEDGVFMKKEQLEWLIQDKIRENDAFKGAFRREEERKLLDLQMSDLPHNVRNLEWAMQQQHYYLVDHLEKFKESVRVIDCLGQQISKLQSLNQRYIGKSERYVGDRNIVQSCGCCFNIFPLDRYLNRCGQTIILRRRSNKTQHVGNDYHQIPQSLEAARSMAQYVLEINVPRLY